MENESGNGTYQRNLNLAWWLGKIDVGSRDELRKLKDGFRSIKVIAKSDSNSMIFGAQSSVKGKVFLCPFLACLVDIALSKRGLHGLEELSKLVLLLYGFWERLFWRIVHCGVPLMKQKEHSHLSAGVVLQHISDCREVFQ